MAKMVWWGGELVPGTQCEDAPCCGCCPSFYEPEELDDPDDDDYYDPPEDDDYDDQDDDDDDDFDDWDTDR